MPLSISDVYPPKTQPPPPPKKPKVPYEVPLSAEQFLTNAKRMAYDHRVLHPDPIDRVGHPVSVDRFMVLEFKSTAITYSAVIRSSYLDKLMYLVSWDKDRMEYNLQVFSKTDHQTYRL